jgi:hypothetical protein
MEFFNDYMVLMVVGICMCVGYVLKNFVPSEKVNKFIPLIMAVLGIAINIWLTGEFTPAVLLGGMFSGLASTGMHQAFKQLIGGEVK